MSISDITSSGSSIPTPSLSISPSAITDPVNSFKSSKFVDGSKDFLNSLVQLKESIVNRYNVNNDTINKFLHLVISNDKHIAKYSLQKKNFLEKIYNLSLKKLYENISLKIIKIFNIKKFILEDGQAIIQYIKKQK